MRSNTRARSEITSKERPSGTSTVDTVTPPYGPPNESSRRWKERTTPCSSRAGLSAVTTLLLAMLRSGDHLVLTADCYRRTRQFVSTMLSRFGVRHTLVDPGDYDALEGAIEGGTRLLLSEAPTNPYLRVVDVERLAATAHKHPRVKLV